MSLLTALAILLHDHPDSFLKERMIEAARVVRKEELRSDSFLCRETLIAIRKMRKRK